MPTTRTAASLSTVDVQAAVDASAAGDIVNLPAGTSPAWATWVNVIKPITITGAGMGTSGGTIIQNLTLNSSGNEVPAFVISYALDQRFEISKIRFVGAYNPLSSNNGACALELDQNGTLVTQICIHDCYFDSFAFAIKNGDNGNMLGFGCCWNCTFHNCKIPHRVSGFGNITGAFLPASRPTIPVPAWGTAYYFVFEDCIYDFVNWAPYNGASYLGDTEYPANYMVRKCTANIGRAAGAQEIDGFDMHGSGNSPVPTNALVNGYGIIVHDNVFNYSGGTSVGAKLIDIRGGVGCLCWNNAMHGQNGDYIAIRTDPPGSVAPAQAYTWNNTMDAGPITDPGSVGPPAGYTEIAYPHPLRSTSMALATALSRAAFIEPPNTLFNCKLLSDTGATVGLTVTFTTPAVNGAKVVTAVIRQNLPNGRVRCMPATIPASGIQVLPKGTTVA
jgi:hypothetical protein